MNSSLSWNEAVNPCFDWLPERTEWSCPLGPVRLRWLLILIWDIDLVLFFHFKNRPKRTQKRNLTNNHIHLTLPQYAYIPGTSYVAKLRVLSGRGNGRDRARQTTPSVEQANRDSIPVRQWVRQCAGQISSTSQNPFTNHDLPGFFAYPTRHRRE